MIADRPPGPEPMRGLWSRTARHPRDGCAASEFLVAIGRLPVLRPPELRTSEKLRPDEIGASEVRVIEHCSEQIRAGEIGTDQRRAVQYRTAQIGLAEIGLCEIRA